MLFISIIVTTYNWPEALLAVINSLLAQTYQHYEIIIADDGSSRQTTDLVQQLKKTSAKTIKYISQEDKGFRAATIRNKAITIAAGDYLVFIDGDCLTRPHFLQEHAKLAKNNYFVAGNRVLINESFSQHILSSSLAIHDWSLKQYMAAARKKLINRSFTLMKLPLGILRNLTPQKWQGAKTCNLAVWKNDFIKVNGFDERFQGWGYEDSDLVIRLIRQGINRRNGHYATTLLHLWHQENDRTQEKTNLTLLKKVLHATHIQAIKGVSQYL